jgi:hypothetical protein
MVTVIVADRGGVGDRRLPDWMIATGTGGGFGGGGQGGK